MSEKLIYFEGTYIDEEYPTKANPDVLAAGTIDGYPKDDRKRAQSVATIYLTKSGDFVYHWDIPEYAIDPYAQEALKEAEGELRNIWNSRNKIKSPAEQDLDLDIGWWETEYGEKQGWLECENGRTIEIVHESHDMPEGTDFWSVRLHCSEGEFEAGKYAGTIGVISTSICQTESDALEKARKLFQGDKENVTKKVKKTMKL